MRFINSFLCAGVMLCILTFTGCAEARYDIPYDVNSNISAYSFETSDKSTTVESFAKNICVVDEDITTGSPDLSLAEAACLFDLTKKQTVYSKGANIKLHPASTTKIMTAILALKYGKPDDILTASENVEIKEKGAQLCGFKAGDKATLDQVLHGLIMHSGNDAGIMIAEYISGDVESFAKLMTEEARKLGATNTNFLNPHGLTEEDHLTTAYDLYLIMNEAVKYDKFKELLTTKQYISSYTTKSGASKELRFDCSNRFLNGKKETPENVTVLGGKTGTTKAAGSCLVLYSKSNISNDEYISVVLNSESTDTLYDNTASLLKLEQ